MPLFRIIENNYFSAAVWFIVEDEIYFLKETGLKSNIKNHQKRKQFFASRLALKTILPDFDLKAIEKFYNEPHLPGSDFKISFSHSDNYAIAAISKFKIGVDIQTVKDGICRIQNKLIHEKEKEENSFYALNDVQTTIVWSLKEAAYKCSSYKPYSFSKNYVLNDVDFNIAAASLNKSLIAVCNKTENSEALTCYHVVYNLFVVAFALLLD